VHVAADGTAAHFSVPDEIEPRSLVLGPDGNLWFSGIKGRYLSMHSENRGDLYVGRMTPAGEFQVYRPSPGGTEAIGIAAGPDGRLWFTEFQYLSRLLGTIAINGQLGEVHFVHQAVPRGPLVLGPDGNFWLGVNTGLLRVTPWNQETLYPLAEPLAVAVGREGAIWTLGARATMRVVPGGPGIDVWKVTADPRRRTVEVLLACGGTAAAGCAGTVELALKVPREQLPKGAKRRLVGFARVRYSVPAEATQTRTIALPARAFKLARRYQPQVDGKKLSPVVIASATVAGGPTATRKTLVPTLVSTP
jgi:streptogramin lyase